MSVSLRIINKNKNDKNIPIYEEATQYFMGDLLTRKKKRINDNVVRIDVKINAVMGDEGECFTRTLKDNSIIIRIKFSNNMSFPEKLVTLRHECVHAKQFMVGELEIIEKSFKWKNKTYNDIKTTGATYHSYPWEKEAYKKQKRLAVKFINFYLSKKNFS